MLGAAAVVASGPALVVIAVLLILVLAWTVPPRMRPTRVFWWMNPAWAILIAVMPGLLLCTFVPESFFLAQWDTPKYITGGHVLLMLALVAAFIVGSQGAARVIARTSDDFLSPVSAAAKLRLERAARLLFWITIAGYVVWTVVGVARGLRAADVANIFAGGGIRGAKDFLAPVAGVTTIAQFGPLAVICLILARHLGTEMRTNRYLVAMAVLATIRTFVYGERLAMIELAVPAIILFLVLPRSRPKPRPSLTLLPIWAPIVLLLFFGTFEYFRSYSSDYYQQAYAGRSYADFTVTRMGAYYATSANNGVLLQRSDQRTDDVPYYVLSAAWNFPLIGGTFPYEELAGTKVTRDYDDFLTASANPEYNNTGGLLLPVFDLGVTGALGFWLLAGAGVGVAFRRFKAGDVRGLLLYPVLFVGVLECGRILYWTTGRAMPSLIGALVLGGMLHRDQARHATNSTSPLEIGDESQESRGLRRPIELSGVRSSRVVA